jgi:hypothetical protein
MTVHAALRSKAAPARKTPIPAQSAAVTQALRSVTRGSRVQAKGFAPSNDQHERQADQVANAVLGFGGAPAGWSLGSIPTGIQRKCSRCEEEQRSRLKGIVMRKCACGAAPGEECSCASQTDEEIKLGIDRKARPSGRRSADAVSQVNSQIAQPGRPLERGVRRNMEQRFGFSFEGVRVHDDARAAASARAIDAHAYTVGNHIVFGQGQYRPGTRSGRFLLAHELAHTIQQSGGRQLQPHGSISQPHDAHERQADAAASAVVAGGPVPALTPTASNISRYSFGEFLDDVADTASYAVDEAGQLAGYVVESAEEAWDTASSIASAIGSAVSFSGGRLTVTVPAFDPCPEFAVQFSLGDLGLAPSIFIPIVEGVVPLTGIVNLYGAVGLNVTLDPEIGLQLVGCTIGPTVIMVDPLSAAASLSGALSVTGALSLGATLDLGLRGEVGVLIIIPDPPIPLQIPVAGIEIGGTAQARVIGGGTITDSIAISAGLGSFSRSERLSGTLALAGDLGVGAYGSIDVLGVTLCRLVWPLYEWHDDIAGAFDIGLDLSISTSGIDASLDVTTASLSTSPFDTMPLALDRSVLQDDCPLCDALYEMGLMPSQNGGSWHGYPVPEFGGPLVVYPKDPGTTGALCRGVCGVDCAPGSCPTPPIDKYVCEEIGDGHIWHVYAGYIECSSAQGCRDHDACYDWAVGYGEGGLAGIIFGPIHRLCDFECLCNYGAPTCINWALANPGPRDSIMNFADYAYSLPGCRGPCPQETETEEGAVMEQTCLPDIEIFPQIEVFSDRWDRDFGPVNLYKQFIEVPYIGGIWVGVDAWAHAAAEAFAELGPVGLANMCLNYDRGTGEYYGTASLVAGLNIGGGVSLTGAIDAWGSDFFCLLRVVDIEGGLNARANAAIPSTVSYDVTVLCRNGELWLDHGVNMETCLQLSFDLDAFFNLDIFTIRLIEERWNLVHSDWEDCWDMTLDFAPLLIGDAPTITFDSDLLRVLELVQWLFGEATDQRGITGIRDIGPDPARERGLFNPCGGGGGDQPPPQQTCTQVIEDPLTAARAHTLGSLVGRIDRTNWATELFSLPTGGSDTVGVEMESPFLTNRHAPGDDDTDSAQLDIYGFRKLPQRGAHGGSGYRTTQVYIKGHLLNGNIGGPAEDRNLYPITGKANSDHERQVERRVKEWVRDDELLAYYKVQVTNRSQPQLIDVFGDGTCLYYYSDSALNCTFATYKLCNDEIVERNPETNRTVRSDFDLPGFIQSVRTKGCPQRP